MFNPTTATNGVDKPALDLEHSGRVPISSLDPDKTDTAGSYVEAQIVLVWPYSSSTGQFAFLLSERDARPLKSGRQVKITLHNGAAREAQACRPGIGDTVKIALKGCHWSNPQDQTLTPGKRSVWDITFREAVYLQVRNNLSQSWSTVDYNAPDPSSPDNDNNGAVELISSPSPKPTTVDLPFKSPTLRTRIETVGFLNSTVARHNFVETFIDEEDRPRKRTKFARPSDSWTLLVDDENDLQASDLPSPVLGRREGIPETGSSATVAPDRLASANEATPADAANEQGNDAQQTDSMRPVELSEEQEEAETTPNEPPATSMGPPKTPARGAATEMHIELPQEDKNQEATTTPRLHPLASPGLPLISPMVKLSGAGIGYFPPDVELTELVEVTHGEIDGLAEPQQEQPLTTRSIERNVEPLPAIEPCLGSSDDDISKFETIQPSTDSRMPVEIPREPSAMSESTSQQHPILITSPSQNVGVGQPRPRDALDVLEEFLQMSPTTEDAPVAPVVAEGAIETESHTRPSALKGSQPVQIEIFSSSEESDAQESASDSQESESEANSETEESVSDSVPEEEQQQQLELTTLVNPSAGAVIDAVESEVQPERQPSVATLDGSIESSEVDVAEHVRLLQGDFRRHEGRATQSIVPQVDPVDPLGLNQLATPPAHTSLEQAASLPEDRIVLDDRMDLVETVAVKSNGAGDANIIHALPTPDHTQEGFGHSSSAVAEAQSPHGTHITETSQSEENTAPLVDQAPTEQADETTIAIVKTDSRRVSQRLSRRLDIATSISSPFFSDSNSNHIEASTSTEVVSTGEPSLVPAIEIPEDASKTVATEKIVDGPPRVEADPALIIEQPTSEQVGTTTLLSYYPPLSSLQQYYNQEVDVIALCAEQQSAPQRAKNGPRDWHTTLKLVDIGSGDSKSLVSAQIFRPYRTALPTVHRGDVAILRNFKVQTARHKCTLLSTDSSAWAIFKTDIEGHLQEDNVTMTGPHLEYGPGELDQVRKLANWWTSTSHSQSGSLSKAAEKLAGTPQSAIDASNAQTQAQPEILPTIEETVHVSPRRSRRNIANSDVVDIGATVGSTESADLDHSIREQPARRARTETPNSALTAGALRSKRLPSIAISSTSPSVASPPVSPNEPRHRTRSAATPVSPSLASVTSSQQSPSLTRDKGKGRAYSPVGGQAAAKRTTRSTRLASPVPNLEKQSERETINDVPKLGVKPAGPQPVNTQASPHRRTRSRRTVSPQPTIHELRDGLQYTDSPPPPPASTAPHPATAQSPPPARTTRARTRSARGVTPVLVHELRDGMRYVDEVIEEEPVDGATAGKTEGGAKAPRRSTRLRSEDVHELRDGVRYVDGRK